MCACGSRPPLPRQGSRAAGRRDRRDTDSGRRGHGFRGPYGPTSIRRIDDNDLRGRVRLRAPFASSSLGYDVTFCKERIMRAAWKRKPCGGSAEHRRRVGHRHRSAVVGEALTHAQSLTVIVCTIAPCRAGAVKMHEALLHGCHLGQWTRRGENGRAVGADRKRNRHVLRTKDHCPAPSRPLNGPREGADRCPNMAASERIAIVVGTDPPPLHPPTSEQAIHRPATCSCWG